MDWKEIISDKNIALHRVSSLIILLLTALTGMILIINPFISEFIKDSLDDYVSLAALIFVELGITIYWVRHRTIFPKGNNSKQNIVIAIATENQKQKVRLTKDFYSNLKNRLFEYGLSTSYDIIILHSHLSKEVRKRIEELANKKGVPDIGMEEADRFNKMTRRINAKLYVYGDLISRNSPDDRYYLNIEALILHNKVDSETGKVLQKEFLNVWKNEIDFLEKEEMTGFKSTSNQIFFASTYMIGLATFVNNRFDIGIQIFENLKKYVSKEKKYAKYKKHVLSLLSSSYHMQATKCYFQGKYDESIDCRRQFHKLTPNEYSKCISESVFQIKKKNNPELALEYLDRAKKLAKKDGTWRYNKLYILVLLKRYDEALELLDRILNYSFKSEYNVVLQVISFNDNCLKEDESHIQSYFFTGILFYKKLEKPIIAYEKIEKFIELSDNLENWNVLNERAKGYLFEIDKIIGVEQNPC